jgi:hypothetical protein
LKPTLARTRYRPLLLVSVVSAFAIGATSGEYLAAMKILRESLKELPLTPLL